MSILVVGSVAFDNIATPSGRVENVLGGAATHFALAASFFTKVRVVAVVGDDFGAEHEDVLKKRGIDTRGIERAPGKTFRWGGHYTDNLNEAKTDFTALNVFEKFQPKIPKEYADTDFLFLANIHPVAANGSTARDERRPADGRRHHELLDQRHAPRTGRDAQAGRRAADQRHRSQDDRERDEPATGGAEGSVDGAAALVIKHGEYGATIFFREGAFGIGHHPFRAPASAD